MQRNSNLSQCYTTHFTDATVLDWDQNSLTRNSSSKIAMCPQPRNLRMRWRKVTTSIPGTYNKRAYLNILVKYVIILKYYHALFTDRTRLLSSIDQVRASSQSSWSRGRPSMEVTPWIWRTTVKCNFGTTTRMVKGHTKRVSSSSRTSSERILTLKYYSCSSNYPRRKSHAKVAPMDYNARCTAT